MENGQQIATSTRNDDRISSLPWDIHRHIISFLPMRDAARMACLSRKWRAVFYALPNLIFSHNEFPQLELDHFVEFISQMISLHDESEIETFKLNIWPYNCNLEWILFALEHKVKCLILVTQIGQTQMLPSRLFISKSLEVLNLTLYGHLLKLPTKIFLPNLTELALATLLLDDADWTQNLFSSCPLLEILIFYKIHFLSNLKMISISAPNLKILRISHCYRINECKIILETPSLLHFIYESDAAEEILFKTAPPIYDASVIFQAPITGGVMRYSQFNCAVKVLKGLRHASNLLLSEWFTEFLFSNGHYPLKNLFACGFSGLVVLKLNMWPEQDHVGKVISLLGMFQKIRELILIIPYEARPPNIPGLELNSQDLDLVDFVNLEMVVVNDFGGQDCVFEVMEFVLNKTRILKDMIIPIPIEIDDVILPGETNDRKRAIIIEKLSVFSTTFPNAPIYFE